MRLNRFAAQESLDVFRKLLRGLIPSRAILLQCFGHNPVDITPQAAA
jgi:hypothetical protein